MNWLHSHLLEEINTCDGGRASIGFPFLLNNSLLWSLSSGQSMVHKADKRISPHIGTIQMIHPPSQRDCQQGQQSPALLLGKYPMYSKQPSFHVAEIVT
jgi:hypothetical protein